MAVLRKKGAKARRPYSLRISAELHAEILKIKEDAGKYELEFDPYDPIEKALQSAILAAKKELADHKAMYPRPSVKGGGGAPANPFHRSAPVGDGEQDGSLSDRY